ncbi:MAG: HNH endonuclease [Endomicrobia bacterium]|nr:HNH endonuclease [Endomicrobiia bacterium]
MQKEKIENIIFDEEDAKLFALTGDLLLKAKSIRYSIIPKLNVVLEEALSRVRKIYGIEVFSDKSIRVQSSPNFREERKGDMKVNYKWANTGITGTRADIWKAFKRKDDDPVKIIPYTFTFEIDSKHMYLEFNCRPSPNIIDSSYVKFLNFIKSKMAVIQSMMYNTGFYCWFDIDQKIIPFDEMIDEAVKFKKYWFIFTKFYYLPSTHDKINKLINSFVILYPMFDSLINIAQGKKERFDELVSLLNSNLKDLPRVDNEIKDKLTEEENSELLSKKVDKVKIVRAGIRWQTFERDDFKCVACGKSADDGAILHVDHILPRSKGGKDEITNYQTLCHVCNIGKSNKSQLNLRDK